MPDSVGDLGEHALIQRIRRHTTFESPAVVVGIGDDAAVVEPDRGMLTVLTTDALVDGVHFDRRFCPLEAVGHRALAVNLSDLASMGASPRHVLLSMGLPSSLAVSELDDLLDGLFRIATRFRTAVIGGNITCSKGPLFVDVMAVGSAKRRRLLRRDTVRAGDDLYVSGEIGGAAAGLASLRASLEPSTEFDGCRQRYLRPQPRVCLGTQLGRNRAARSCIDLSDGLADGVHQLATSSRVGMLVNAEDIPIAPDARLWFESQGADPVTATLTAGDDYELLFSAPPSKRRAINAVGRLAGNLPLTRIGLATGDRVCLLRRNGKEEPLPGGFEHFRQ